MPTRDEKRIDVQGMTLAWGDAARWKARLREESLRAWDEKPLAERLLIALSMVRRRGDRGAAG